MLTHQVAALRECGFSVRREALEVKEKSSWYRERFFSVIYGVIRTLQRGRSPAAEIYDLGKLQNLLHRLVLVFR